MRKRIFSLTLVLALLAGLLPAAARAADEPAHSHDGRTAVTMGETYIKLGEEEQTANTLPDGSYYLAGDLAAALTVDGAVDLCLNGHSVTVDSGSAVTVGSGASLTLWDCAAGNAGRIAYTGSSSSCYGIYTNGTLTLNGGAVESAYRGVHNGGTFTMTGGAVEGSGSSGYGVYNYSSTSVFRLSGGAVSGGKYGIYNNNSGSQVYLSGSPTVTGTTADIYTNSYSSKIYADDGGSENTVPYSGQPISLRYSSASNGNTIVYHVTEDIKGKFTLTGSISDNYELKYSAEDNALKFQGKPQTLTWYDINEQQLSGEGYPASIPYYTYLESSRLPAAPAVDGKLFLGWLYKKGDASAWSTDYWSGSSSIKSATFFKADYIDSFTGGGSGTADDPYRLADAADLQTLSTLVYKEIDAYNNGDVWYQLTADIDLSTVCGEGIGSWTPIGYGEGNSDTFKANLDGSGRTISNLYINTSSSGQGLFGGLDGATVKNLKITGSVAARSDYGALAGDIYNGSVVENVDVTGVTLTPYGHTTDGNRVMAYKVDDDRSTIHIQGNYKNNWIQTTYARAGYSVEEANLDGASVAAEADFINGGRYVQLSYTVTAGETAVTGGKLAVHADVQIGDNDGAAVEVIRDADGEVIGLKMVDDESGNDSYNAQFNLYFDGTGGVTPVDTYWFGYYDERTNNHSTYGKICFAPLNDETKSRGRTYEQVDGVYTRLTGTDSGFAVSWQNIDLDPGESKTYSFILGVGEKADPPRWGDGNAVSLTLAADVEQNNRLVNVSARVKDAAGLTDTLYYSVDGGDGVVLGEVEADGAAMKAITGRLDLSGYPEGAYVFSFWVVNSKGAASDSVEREITITADGIRGLDGDEAGYGISGTVEKQDSPVEGAEVTLMRGSAKVAGPVKTGQDGTYTFTGVAPGSYNVVATKDGKTMTILVRITNQSAKNQNIEMPDGNKNSVVEVTGADTPAVVAGGVDKIAETEAVNAGETVTVKLTVEKKAENAADYAGEIRREAGGKTLDFLELKLERTVTGGVNDETTNITDTRGKVLEIVVPFTFDGKDKNSVTVYRYHNGRAETLTRNQGNAKTGGTFKLGTDSVTIYATKFSTYAIGYTPAGGTPAPTPEPATPPVYTGGDDSGPAAYPVSISDSTPTGAVKLSHRNAGRGTTVTITVTPDQGYALSKVTVTDRDGKEIAVTSRGNGIYTFVMPGGKVTVTGAFTKITGGYEDCPRDGTCPLWPYSDMSVEAWYHGGVHYCIEGGLMSGYGNGLFGPNDSLSRAQFARILYNREGRPAVGEPLQYDDAEAGAWYTGAVRWASGRGIVSGYGNGRFGPNDSITREQLAVMLWRYAGSPAAAERELPFTDADKAGGYALEALRWTVEKGIINGRGDGRLDPRGLATRAQAAQILMKFLERQEALEQ